MSNILAFDIGKRKIGVAIANKNTGFPSPLTTITNDDKVWDKIKELINENDAEIIVAGMPRSLSGQETEQTIYTREFVDTLGKKTLLKIEVQDEDLTSHKAETELKSKKRNYTKADIDALAATFILEDYLLANESGAKR